ncbi:hypothetical protein BAE44_0004760 [Dichanthelium oligosanthes]|uniref:Telomere-associated protein Rif1 N-terminal domain-containing protein n=1 Tax=Dichanthelium oligosanthes TaxID=888268 RepID=A0A1E5WA10_9POAL|nr:hypothetical protein BAE44_0004760 [Dichanthelium oligosanthes]
MPPPPAPPSVAREVAEIAAELDRAAAYAWLLHLQRGCADDPSAAADLAAELPSPILPLLLRDAADPDEAVAGSALKCLGFALYHPVLVSTISAQMAQAILDTLVQLIMNTRMKSVCNLGVWCISVQQLEPLIIEDRADPVVTAIVHALDNPFGSFSTTFEAAQAVMKLACQSHKRMRDLSSLWVPPIYRRLLSADKPERDMAERCLIKVSCVILPPQPLLSKAVALDLERKLLSCMKNMLDDPLKKVQAMKSWGWIISLLGPEAVNNRPLLNKLLKIPEQMFIDLETQVQIATMVSWRNLVDAFFPSQATESMGQETVIAPLESREHANAQVKRTRLIMVPLCRVLSRSRNIVLSSSCLNTWNYLLHRLGNLINHLPILEVAFGPILKIIFSFGINDQNKPLWSFCMNLFHDFSSSESRHKEDLCTPVNRNLVAQSCMHLKALLDVQHIKWLPWDFGCFHFQLDILDTILNPVLFQDMVPEKMLIVMDSATQIFRFLLRALQNEVKENRSCEQVRLCITDVCKFVKTKSLDHVGKHSGNKCAMLLEFGLQFVKVIVRELDHSLLNSEKIEICLDINHIKENESAERSPKVSFPRIRPLSYMEMVSPSVYMTSLSLSMIAQYTGELLHGDAEKLALILSSSGSLKSFDAVVAFMYMQIMCPIFNRQRLKWLMVWNKFAKLLNDEIISYLKASSGSSSYDVLNQFFCYPLFSFLYPGGLSILWNAENGSCAPGTQELEVELAVEGYRSLCTSSCNSKAASKVFFEGFYEYLVNIIDEHMALFQDNLEHCPEKFENTAILSVLGEAIIGLLQNDQILAYANQELNETNEEFTGCRQPNLFLSCLNLVNRFMRFSRFGFKANPAGQHMVTSRFFSSLSNFVGHVVLKKDILLLFEIIGDQLTEWLSLSAKLYCEMQQQGKIIYQLENLWLKILECLKIRQLISDGPFTQKRQLLQLALNHPHHAISVATASACRAETNIKINLHSGCLGPKLDGLLMDRRKDHNSSSGADEAIAREEIVISSRLASPTSKKRTKHTDGDAGSLKISAGLGRKRLKIIKTPFQPVGDQLNEWISISIALYCEMQDATRLQGETIGQLKFS